jgi:hypothetical protein
MVQNPASFDDVTTSSAASLAAAAPVVGGPAEGAAVEGALDRVDELLSYFFDDELSPDGAAELNAVLLANESARSRCFEMARLHADLYAHFRSERGVSVEGQAEASLKLVSEAIATMAKSDTTES